MIWKTHPVYEFLEGSEDGYLRIKPFQARSGRGGLRWYIGKPTKGVTQTNKQGYQRYWFGNAKYGLRRKSHQLLCEIFHGLKPFDKAVVMHLDDNPLNNHKDNLKWGTQKENLNTESFIAYCRQRGFPKAL